MAHRGPDGTRWIAPPGMPVVFGHGLLSITGFGGVTKQPMVSEDGNTLLTANGEIYNHRDLRQQLEACGHVFRTDSDNEVLLHGYEEWGEGCESRLEGSWTFALWDGGRERLVLSRDPFGVRPLYFSLLPAGVVFASEVRALLSTGLFQAELDQEGLAGYLEWQSLPAPFTLVRQIRAVRPGHRLGFARGSAPTQRWHTPLEIEPEAGEAVSAAEILETVAHAVRVRLPADVPGGLLVSGGLDSGLVAAVAAREGFDLQLFSLGFGKGFEAFDETEAAKKLAGHLGLPHRVFVPEDGDVRELFDSFLGSQDQPSTDAFNTYLACHATQGRVRVLLSGVGADELFLGYPHLSRRRLYTAGGSLDRWLGHPRWEPVGAEPAMRAVRTRISPLGVRRLFTPGEAGILLGGYPAHPDAFEPPPQTSGHTDVPKDSRLLYLRHDLRHYLPWTLLRDLDFATMAHGIEGRTPYLDLALARTVLRLPLAARATPRHPKSLLRRAAEPLLPHDHVWAPKRCFDLPFRSWLLGPLKERIDLLSADGGDGPFDGDRVRMLVRQFRRGLLHPKKILALAQARDWLERHGIA